MKNSFYISNKDIISQLGYDKFGQRTYLRYGNGNGNMLYHDGANNDWYYFWDEGNRLRSAVENGVKMTHFIYDAAGERTLKANAEYHGLYENGTPTDEGATLNGYTTYPSPYITVDAKSQYTKHYFAGSQRVASKPAGSASVFNMEALVGDLQELKNKQFEDAQAVADTIGIGDLELGDDAIDPGNPPINIFSIFYFHPDHLGSSTVLTEASGNAYQLFLNLPFGETMAEQRRSSFETPYKFNGKELDANTGLYYYGARYYDPRVSNWLSVDPLAEEFPGWSPYNYTLQNPINIIDPDGRDIIILYDSKAVYGLGHSAVLIGNDKDGWRYVSMNGTGDGAKPIGISKNADLGNIKGQNDFRGTGMTYEEVIATVQNSNPKESHNYDKAIRIYSDNKEDSRAYKNAKKEANSKWYNIFGQSCIDPGQAAFKGIMEERYGEETTDDVFFDIDTQLVTNNQEAILLDQIESLNKVLKKQGEERKIKASRVMPKQESNSNKTIEKIPNNKL